MKQSPKLFIQKPHEITNPSSDTTRIMLGHDDTLMMLKMDFEKGAIGTVHQHEHTQATYVLSGSFEFTIGNDVNVVNQGDACFMPSNIPHGCVCLEKGSLLDVFTPERKDFL